MATALKKCPLTRNFQGYSTDSASLLLAFGTSAISSLRTGYLQNTVSNHAYYAALDVGKLPIAKGIKIQKGDLVIRRLIEQLMCYMEIDLKAFTATEGLTDSYFTPALKKLEPLMMDGLVLLKEGVLSIPEAAPQAVRLACAAFDPHLSVSTKKHVQVA